MRFDILATACALCVLGASSIALSAPSNLPTTVPVQFLIVGDTGTGQHGQYSVAAAMETVCAKRGCQFAVGLGDNIYEYGSTSVDDPQFKQKFEKPYARLAFPFFMLLGNHDQSGFVPGSGVHPERGDYEVEYTQRSSKWVMPDRYYRFGVPFASATDFKAQVTAPIIEFFAIDSCHLAPQNRPQHDWYTAGSVYDIAQRTWLRDALATSRAGWKFVLAHHPYRSNGKAGNAGEFFGFGLAKGHELKKFYEEVICDKVDFLASGHDHSLQWLGPAATCGKKTQFLISGAGAKFYAATPAATQDNPAFYEAFGKLGFFWATATADSLTIAAYTVDAKGVPTLAFEKTLNR